MGYEYDIAISFAGEDRSIADAIAQRLKTHQVKVFYDKFEEANLWGEDLYVHLHEVYSNKARFCIMLLSEHYARKAWTNHERESAQERAFKEREAYILPIKLDDTSIPGIRDTVGYISLKNKSIDDIVTVILAKLGNTSTRAHSGGVENVAFKPVIQLPQVKKIFTERDKDLFIKKAFIIIHDFFVEGVKQLTAIPEIEADLDEVTSLKFMCKVYVQGKSKSACTIWISSQYSSNNINYINQANPDANNSLNESLAVNSDNTALFLKPAIGIFGYSADRNMDGKAAAEYYWAKLIDPLNK